MSKEKPIYLWKSLMKGTISGHGNHKWRTGKWYKIKDNLEICNKGFHASKNIIDAMRYCNMEVLAKVEVRGINITQANKQCWSEMRIIKKWIWQKEDSMKLAIYSASSVLKNFENKFPDDKRPRLVIKAARDYLKGMDVNLSAAAEAAGAEAAIWTAIMSEKAAGAVGAKAAVWTAAVWAAIWAAGAGAAGAEAAVWTAIWAAEAGMKEKCHNWILKHINQL